MQPPAVSRPAVFVPRGCTATVASAAFRPIRMRHTELNDRLFPIVLRCTVALSLVASCSIVWAARTFPQNSRQVKITQAADGVIVADGRTLHLAPGVLIFTSTNATLVRGALPTNVIARVQVDLNGDVRRIWLLADDEILVRPWWQIWKSDQPQAPPEPTTTPQ